MLKKFIELPGGQQLLIIIAVFSIGFNLLQLGKFTVNKYNVIKSLEQQIETLQDSLQESQNREDKIIAVGKSKTKQTDQKAKAIDQKLKEDEKIIDSSDVTIIDINSYISKHQK